MNIGSTYDGDMGNEVVLGDITVTGFNNAENLKPSHPINIHQVVVIKQRFKPWKLCNCSITFSMREPVMVEPLDHYSSRGGNKTTISISNIDLEYNFNILRNMIHFNYGKMYDISKKFM